MNLLRHCDKFPLLQDQASSEDINSADIKQLELILTNCAGEPHRLETKAMDTKGGLTGILQLPPEFSDTGTFLGNEKFSNSQAFEREDCERFEHCSQFRAVIYFFPSKVPERRVRG